MFLLVISQVPSPLLNFPTVRYDGDSTGQSSKKEQQSFQGQTQEGDSVLEG